MSAHLDDATWEKLALGELAGPDRRAALEHVMACARCRAIHRGLGALEADARAEGLLPAVRRRTWIAAVGFAAAAAAAVLVWWQLGSKPEEPVLRGSGAPTIEVTAPAAIRTGEIVTWTAVGGATEYRVEVFAGDGTLTWSDRSASPKLAWPAIAPGTYTLRVVAGDAVSKLIPIAVRP